MQLFILNEFTVILAVWHGLMKTRPCVVAIEPFIPFTKGFLQKFHDFFVARGWFRPLLQCFPDFEFHVRHPNYSCLTPFFMRCEPWIDEYFKFSEFESGANSYNDTYKNIAWGYVDTRSNIAVLLNDIWQKHKAGITGISGLDEELVGLCRQYSGAELPGRVWLFRYFRPVLNAVFSTAIAAYSILWLVRHISLRTLPEKNYLIGTNNLGVLGNVVNLRLLHDVADDPKQVCVVFFDQIDTQAAIEKLGGFNYCDFNSGRLGPLEALQTAWMLIRDITAITLRHATLRTPMFLRMVKLPYHRATYRAFLARYHIDYFWGRDDYNEVHIMRTQEMRRRNMKSLGMNHGIPTTEIIHPCYRYLDFDTYYMFGADLYQKYFSERWPKHMTVCAAGSFAMTRDMLKKIQLPKSRDIIYFVNPDRDEKFITDTAIELAKLFPDRRVYFKIKPGRRTDGFYADFADDPTVSKPENLIVTDEEAYSLMLRHGYAVATISTVVLECIYFGVSMFVLDTQPSDALLYYRDFPRLCHRSAQEISARIRAIERNEETYPWHFYDDLVNQSENLFSDLIRREIGLEPKASEPWIRPWRTEENSSSATGTQER